MKSEEAVTAVLGGTASASPLGSHAFLDEFALALPLGGRRPPARQAPGRVGACPP
jgi:hypothetical protein